MSKASDRRQAREASYRYLNNPYPEGSRLARYFDKAKQHKENMDAQFDELEDVYGTIGTPKALIANIPNSFNPYPTAVEAKACTQ